MIVLYLADDGAQLINQIWKQQIGKSFYYIWQKTTKKMEILASAK